ncbi:MAG: hypothetical protein IPL96_05680, partial [Holophagaceae bacterium]|nr:hypothetical protein [Holophagaceae bacterium]
PAFCRYRVYIVDEVHMLSRQAFDALLKILEEPPPHAVFVLATTELQDVPDTIKSRVQIYPFRLIPTGLIEGRLRHVCEAEGVGFEDGSLRLVAEAGQGSMRDALTTLDRVIAAGDGFVKEDGVREQLGIVPAVRVLGVLEALYAGDSAAILDHCQALHALGADWSSFWKELMLAFRDRLEADARRDPSPQALLRSARMLQLLLQRERDLRDTSLPRVVVELALLTAAQLPHLASLDALVGGGAGAAGRVPAGGPAGVRAGAHAHAKPGAASRVPRATARGGGRRACRPASGHGSSHDPRRAGPGPRGSRRRRGPAHRGLRGAEVPGGGAAPHPGHAAPHGHAPGGGGLRPALPLPGQCAQHRPGPGAAPGQSPPAGGPAEGGAGAADRGAALRRGDGREARGPAAPGARLPGPAEGHRRRDRGRPQRGLGRSDTVVTKRGPGRAQWASREFPGNIPRASAIR